MDYVKSPNTCLVNQAKTYLSVYDEKGFHRYIANHWTTEELINLLESTDVDDVKVAATSLGILCDVSAIKPLIRMLSHENAVVSAMAEYSIWTIWFEMNGKHAATQLRRACYEPDYRKACNIVNELINLYPDWAEAYNQRAIIHYKSEYYIYAQNDCLHTLSLFPDHFGSLSTLGHTCAKLGKYEGAIMCYRNVMNIHPRMSGIRQSLRTVGNLMRDEQVV